MGYGFRLGRFLLGVFFFFNDTATTEIYTLSLHDALPICQGPNNDLQTLFLNVLLHPDNTDRKSTRLNSSHITISYAVFCLKKKKTTQPKQKKNTQQTKSRTQTMTR